MRKDRERWDARYASGERRHDSAPAPLLVEWLPRWPAGRALDIAAGLGRHALMLAGAGWTTDAVDISAEALRILHRRAREAGVTVNIVLADLDAFACRPRSYDLIVDTFYLSRPLIPKFWRWLRPGGAVVFETHLATPGADGGGRYALARGAARPLFAGWEVLAYAEGPEEDGPRVIDTVRLVARRPPVRRSARS
jgi:SAM-dependent methyltransferase